MTRQRRASPRREARAGEAGAWPEEAAIEPAGPACVLGAGSWGTALAAHLGRAGKRVRLWGHDPDRTRELARGRENRTYLPGVEVPAPVEVTTDLSAALRSPASLVVLAVPSHFVRSVLAQASGAFPAQAPLLIATKGIEVGSLKLMTEVAADELGLAADRLAVLSGPSFAVEVARGHPTAVVAASVSPALARGIQVALASDSLRLYTNQDPLGVQICGALKNVMAIAAGIVTGMGLGTNSVAALVTRGLAEMQRLGMALGARAATFSGLAGLGDLVLTATGALSRNRQVGIGLGEGRRPEEILSGMMMVAEGIRTAQAASSLAAARGVEMPIVEQVRRVLYDDLSPREAVAELMGRTLKGEEWG